MTCTKVPTFFAKFCVAKTHLYLSKIFQPHQKENLYSLVKAPFPTSISQVNIGCFNHTGTCTRVTDVMHRYMCYELSPIGLKWQSVYHGKLASKLQ